MWPLSSRTLGLVTLLGCAVASAWCSGSPISPSPTAQVVATPAPPVEVPVNESPAAPTAPTLPPTGAATTWVNIFGDTGWCGSPVMASLARLMTDLGGDIFLAGDLAYPSGTIEEFRRCFDPELGRFRSRFWAAPGNHDYQTAGAAGYFTYFGERAGLDRKGYYAIGSSTWQVLMVNSNVANGRNSAQIEWVRQQLRASPARCTLAVMHHPFDSSGPNGPNPQQRDLWDVMHGLGVDVVVSAHEHLYERHAPQDANQRADPVRGIRLFIAGTGGAPPYGRARAAGNSEVLITAHGLLRLKLEPALYEWEFRDVNGAILDRGLNICH